MSEIVRAGWRSLAGIVLSAALFWLYSLGGAGFALGFVALVPWLLVLETKHGLAAALRSAWFMSVAFVAAVFAWFGVAFAAYLNLGAATGLTVLLLAAPLLQPQWFAFVLARQLAGRRHGPILRALAGASAWVACEWVVPKLLGDTIGHGLYPSPLLRQCADLGGAAGLSFALILVNEAIAGAVLRRRDGKRVWMRPVAAAAAIVIAMAGYGATRLSMLASTAETAGTPLRIGIVQSNIVDYERLRHEIGAYAVVRRVLDTHYAMSREAIDRHHVDALLWSETVYPTTFAHPKSDAGGELDRELQGFVDHAGVPLVFGTYDLDENGEYNAAAFVEPKTGLLGFYRKTRLFLFTEYVPPWLDGPLLRRALPWAGTWQRGSGARVLPLRLADGREIPVQPLICLDDVDSDLAIDGARLGAQALLGMSNDSWFTQYPAGARLHLTVAAFRSIETRLPQLRVTNNGFSASIDAIGAVTERTAMSEQALLAGQITVREPPPTLMKSWGDWVGRAALAWLILLATLSALRAIKRRMARAVSPASAAGEAEVFHAEVAVLSPVWRFIAASLRVFARGALLWMGVHWLTQDAQANALSQIRMFASMVLMPELAAWSILRAFAAIARIEGDALVLEQGERRTEIAAKDIVAIEPWRLPLPGFGVGLRLCAGERWLQSLVLRDTAALIDALIRAGAPTALRDASHGFAATYARVCAAVPRKRIDHPMLKFVLFALVPALPAFRLHQIIAYGSAFGEYYSFGLRAYLAAFGIWWASWAINLVMFAAVLRAAIEIGTWLVLALRAERAVSVRTGLVFFGRVAFYVGIPAWFLIRLSS